MNRKLSTVLLFGLFLLASGCQKYGVIKIIKQDNKTTFSFASLGEEIKENKKYILYDISVNKENCTDNCVSWELVRDANYYDTNDFALDDDSIDYGAEVIGMETTIKPQKLSSGRYMVLATVAIIVDGEVVKSNILSNKFTQ